MATKAHKLLTGTDLHESKGVATALAGQVYVTDGAGSGTWTTINTGIQFSTGDVKFTFKTTPDAGWLIPVDGQTIGSTSSGATYADTALYSALYQLIWNGVTNTYAPVAGGRGGSAAADFAANKKMTFPPWMGRAIGAAGAGTGLTSRALGLSTGVESEALTLAQLPTGITSTVAAGATVSTATANWVAGNANDSTAINVGQGGANNGYSVSVGGSPTVAKQAATGTVTSTTTATSNNTSGSVHSLMQPTVFLNLMIKY